MSHESSFWTKYVFSRDHKVIALQYYFLAVAMAIVGGLLAMLIRLQVAGPAETWPRLGKLLPAAMPGGVMRPEFYLSLVTMHGTIMVFFVISLAIIGAFGNYLIPLQVGARDMAFPFLNMLSFWTVVPAAALMLLSFGVEGGAAASAWIAYPPLSAVKAAVPGSGQGQTLWLIAMALFIASFTMGGLNYVTTVLNLRARGLSMFRLPMTVWTLFVSAILGLLAFPPLTAASIMLLFDREMGTSFFLPGGLVFGDRVLPHQGGSPLLWQHLFWFLGHPEVYILILPALGIACDVLPPFARRPLFGHRQSVIALWVIGALSMIVWGHHMYVSGMNPTLGEVFAIGTLAITVPFTILIVNMLATLWRGRLRLDTPMLFVLGLLSFVGTGGLGGLFLGNALSDIYLHDTYFVVGHFHFMIGWVTFFAIFAGTYYWFPKVTGRTMNEALGKVHFWSSFASVYAVFLTMHFCGFTGMMRHIYDHSMYTFLREMVPWNRFITVAAVVLFASQLTFLFNLAWSAWRGARAASANPWESNSLEWSVPNQPPHGNWPGAVPEVVRGPYEYDSLGHSPQWERGAGSPASEDSAA
jgi:cytochrome c oxidase subunit 1